MAVLTWGGERGVSYAKVLKMGGRRRLAGAFVYEA